MGCLDCFSDWFSFQSINWENGWLGTIQGIILEILTESMKIAGPTGLKEIPNGDKINNLRY